MMRLAPAIRAHAGLIPAGIMIGVFMIRADLHHLGLYSFLMPGDYGGGEAGIFHRRLSKTAVSKKPV